MSGNEFIWKMVFDSHDLRKLQMKVRAGDRPAADFGDKVYDVLSPVLGNAMTVIRQAIGVIYLQRQAQFRQRKDR